LKFKDDLQELDRPTSLDDRNFVKPAAAGFRDSLWRKGRICQRPIPMPGVGRAIPMGNHPLIGLPKRSGVNVQEAVL